MTSRRADELLYDSEATLRLVDNVLGELCAPAPGVDEASIPPVRGLRQLLEGVHAEIVRLHNSARASRQTLERLGWKGGSSDPGELLLAESGGGHPDRDPMSAVHQSLAQTEDRLAWLARCLDPETIGPHFVKDYAPPASPDGSASSEHLASEPPILLKKPA